MNFELINKVRKYCKLLIESSRCKNMPFHNWEHTQDVVETAKLIARHENVKDNTLEELIISSYFHDIGHIDEAKAHEELSCRYAMEFLKKEGYDCHRVFNVLNTIKATKINQQPNTVTEKIICDADLAHLGKKNFKTKNSQLRIEWENYNGMKFSEKQWAEMNIAFMKTHLFYTEYAQKNFLSQKLINMKVFKI